MFPGLGNVFYSNYMLISDLEYEIDKRISMKNVRSSDIDNLLSLFGFNYFELSEYLREKIDLIDLID